MIYVERYTGSGSLLASASGGFLLKILNDQNDAAGGGSSASVFEFAAAMVAPQCDAGQGSAGTFVAKEFTLDKVPNSATLRVSALGLYRVLINGRHIGDEDRKSVV